MSATAPPLGLLLDVDGPIASPVSRSISVPSIAGDLVALANAGVPIAFNTGRSDRFLADRVVPRLVEEGLSDDALVWGICEKGAVTARVTPHGLGEIEVDQRLAVPRDFVEELRDLVQRSYADAMFFDDTKRAMVSVEQNVDTTPEEYAPRKDAFAAEAAVALESRGLGYEWDDRRVPGADGGIPFRIDPTIISVDVESVLAGKDLGASKFFALLESAGASLPRRWRTLGDSRTDYAMSDWLHERGHEVVHVDVRPADGVPSKPYPVRHHASAIHDEAGALYLSRWLQMVRGEADDDVLPGAR